MVSVPGFLLRRLYVKGSLRNATGGFEFQIRNTLGSGYARGMLPVTVDGRDIPLDSVYFYMDDKEVPFSAVSEENTFTLAMNTSITIWADGVTLEPGPHKVEMGFDVPGVGPLRFDFTDTVEDG